MSDNQPSAVNPRDLADGIYFRLDADRYHSIERLSCSGIQKLLISPATFWAGSWLDPDRPTDDEDATLAQILGRFYHVARLEPELLPVQYCRKVEKTDFPADGAVYTGTDIGGALAALGLPKTKAGERVLDQAYRLYDAGHKGVIWPIVIDAWEAERGDRIGIAGKTWDEAHRDMDRITRSTEIHALLTGGQAEVSVLWTCPQSGIRMKCRFDYLRPSDWTDLKTFANPMGKNLNQVLTDAFRYNRYYIQAALYRDAVEFIRQADPPIVGDATGNEILLIEAIAKNPADPACWYVFQEKGGVPNILAREFQFFDVPLNTEVQTTGAADPDAMRRATRSATMIYTRAKMEIAKAKRDFMAYSDIYERGEPWLPVRPMGTISDADFNQFWLESEV